MAKTTERSLLMRCFYAIFYGVGGAVGSRVLMAVANILLSQILGQEIFGKFASVNTTVNLFVTFAGMGISATVTRYIAANPLDKRLQGMYIRTLSRICLVMSVIFSGMMGLFAGEISLISTGGTELTEYFRIVAVAIFFASMSSVEQSVLTGYEQFGAGSAVQMIRCGLFCLLGYLFSKRWGIYGAVYTLVITHAVQYGLCLLLSKRYIRRNGIPLRWAWNSQTKQALLTFALPAFAAGLFVLPVNWIGNAILAQTSGFAQVALFAITHQWMSYITYAPSQMGQMRPIYTDLYFRGEGKKLTWMIIRTMIVTAALATLIGTVVVLFSEPILGIYGKGYMDGQYALAFMILAAVFYTAQVQTSFLMQATGRMWSSLAINAVWAAALLGSFWLLRGYGARGYAIAYSTAYFITLLLQVIVTLGILKSIPHSPNSQEQETLS